MKSFADEYRDLEERVQDSFNFQIERIGSISFIEENKDLTDDDDYQSALEDCPTSYYNNVDSGEETHIYITKIDKKGIHVVESDDIHKNHIIGLSNLNGVYYAIELLEEITKIYDKIK